ncbi:hypothetical protein NP493_179g01068 [Ridgeia piscesae]|uniref:Protein Wnt n=1 Tax=Ridgeia piscesae TaxID=27915 RepID=A0AAD9UF19_RIDPI|nr:hypothetical protein NP493_179g01068 [Ridgeia piscesae]
MCGTEVVALLQTLLSFTDTVAAGVRRGMHECRYQFRWHRWNCSFSQPPAFTDTAGLQVTPEMAYVQAISAAGVVHVVAKNCSSGHIDNCRCDETHDGRRVGVNWNWGGCSDDIRFGVSICKTFMDAVEPNKDARAAVYLHNTEAGRRAVRRTLRLMCKCHGVSGSCTTSTCWLQLAQLRSVGNFLKKRHARAVKVDFQNGVMQQQTNTKWYRRKQPIKVTDLLYVTPAPDYCWLNGTQRTLGRHCVRPAKGAGGTSYERRSCRVLCRACGLDVSETQVMVETGCHCRFHWCCAVRCAHRLECFSSSLLSVLASISGDGPVSSRCQRLWGEPGTIECRESNTFHLCLVFV